MVSGDKKVVLETIKLLMQVAWADGEVGEAEWAQIMAAAEGLELNPRNLDLLRQCLTGERKLPAPDLGFLREHAAAAIEAAEKLVLMDEDISEAEGDVLHQLRQLLGVQQG